MSQTIRIATRKSPLALWQAEFVKAKLLQHNKDLDVQLVAMTTRGDVLLDTPADLANKNGKPGDPCGSRGPWSTVKRSNGDTVKQ